MYSICGYTLCPQILDIPYELIVIIFWFFKFNERIKSFILWGCEWPNLGMGIFISNSMLFISYNGLICHQIMNLFENWRENISLWTNTVKSKKLTNTNENGLKMLNWKRIDEHNTILFEVDGIELTNWKAGFNACSFVSRWILNCHNSTKNSPVSKNKTTTPSFHLDLALRLSSPIDPPRSCRSRTHSMIDPSSPFNWETKFHSLILANVKNLETVDFLKTCLRQYCFTKPRYQDTWTTLYTYKCINAPRL